MSITITEIMMNNNIIETIHQEMLRETRYIDVTPIFRDALQNSLCGKLLNLKNIKDPNKFKVKYKSDDGVFAITNSSEVLNISNEQKEVFVPPVEIATYPSIKIFDFINDQFSVEKLLTRSTGSIVRQIDCSLMKFLSLLELYYDDFPTLEKKLKTSEFDTQVMSLSKYKELYGTDVITDQDGKHIIADAVVTKKLVLNCDRTLGTLCFSNLYILPINEPRHLKLGFVVAGAFGFCFHDYNHFEFIYD